MTAGLAIYDTMQYIKPDVATICMGQCASMGALLLAAGAKGKRYALPHSRVMIHQPMGGVQGQATDIDIQAKEILKMKETVHQILVEHTGQSIKKIRQDTERDFFMSGEEALDFLNRRGAHTDAPEVGLVYLDIEMPGMGGQEVLKAIRADARFDHIPVVIMTGLTDESEIIEAASNGANSYTVKPNNPMEFLKKVVETTTYWVDIHRRPSGASISTS